MAAVRARGLVKRYGSTVALDGVDLDVAEGEVQGLLGPNGAGKTTLLRMLFGLVAPGAGTIELFGGELLWPDRVPLDGVAGFVEEPAFYPYLSARANLELLAELDGGATRKAIDEALAAVELSSRGEDRVGGYSTGMRQRLGIAAALLRSPRLLLLDEPTSGLDPAATRSVIGLIRELALRGTAIVLSSHRISEIEHVCDRFTILRRGAVAWSGTVEELRTRAPGSAYALHTSDDELVLSIAADAAGIRAERSPRGALALTADQASLDTFVLALAEAGVAVRRLELLVSPLESVFFALTADEPPERVEPLELAARALERS